VVQLNCRGLLRRDPDKLLAVIQGADVAVLSEIFLSTLDPFPDLHGYRAFNFPREPQRSALGTAGRGGVHYGKIRAGYGLSYGLVTTGMV
jgi:hypothetical protein